jgi:hypothetical protein
VQCGGNDAKALGGWLCVSWMVAGSTYARGNDFASDGWEPHALLDMGWGGFFNPAHA